MTDIRNEFEAYLKEFTETYPRANSTILKNPSSLSEAGNKSKDFNAKANNKIMELAKKYGKSEQILKVELSDILVKYHSRVVGTHF